jgi:hypothetical protein
LRISKASGNSKASGSTKEIIGIESDSEAEAVVSAAFAPSPSLSASPSPNPTPRRDKYGIPLRFSTLGKVIIDCDADEPEGISEKASGSKNYFRGVSSAVELANSTAPIPPEAWPSLIVNGNARGVVLEMCMCVCV